MELGEEAEGLQTYNEEIDMQGIGFVGILAIVFIVLKLTDVIAWSWWWVISPLWIPVAIGLAFIAIGGALALFGRCLKK